MIMLSNRGSEIRRPEHVGAGKFSVETESGGGHPQTLVPWEHRDEDNQISEQGDEENGGGGAAPAPRWGQQGMAHGLWEPLRAPDPGRRQPTLHLPGQRLPRHPPDPRTPRLPLPSADHRELGFQAKALVPDSELAFSRHRVAGTSGVAQASPAKEAPNEAPLGLYHSGGPPLSGQDIRARPSPPGPGSDLADALGLACSGAACAVSQEGGHAWPAFWL